MQASAGRVEGNPHPNPTKQGQANQTKQATQPNIAIKKNRKKGNKKSRTAPKDHSTL